MAIDAERRAEIDAFIKENEKKYTRDELNKVLKRLFNVQFTRSGKYMPHTGLQQRLRNLMKTGLTRDQALDKLEELSNG